MTMRDHPCRTEPGVRPADVVLPAEGTTLARSLSGGLVLVAHTGNAHLGASVDRGFLRDLARARAAVHATREGLVERRDPVPARCDLPDMVPFRHATSHRFGVSGGAVHLTLRAAGERSKPDVEVEVRMDRLLVERLTQHHRREAVVFVLVGLLVMAFAVLASLAHV